MHCIYSLIILCLNITRRKRRLLLDAECQDKEEGRSVIGADDERGIMKMYLEEVVAEEGRNQVGEGEVVERLSHRPKEL